jgi:hypothetical protein
LGVGLTASPQKIFLLQNDGRGQDPHKVVAPVKEKKKKKIIIR